MDRQAHLVRGTVRVKVWLRRIGWLIGLWLLGVLVVGTLAYAMRLFVGWLALRF